jgi:hypothetical protein
MAFILQFYSSHKYSLFPWEGCLAEGCFEGLRKLTRVKNVIKHVEAMTKKRDYPG